METTPKDIRDRAAKALVTMDALFTRAGVKASTFWRWEKGKTKVKPITREKIVQALAAFEAERRV